MVSNMLEGIEVKLDVDYYIGTVYHKIFINICAEVLTTYFFWSMIHKIE